MDSTSIADLTGVERRVWLESQLATLQRSGESDTVFGDAPVQVRTAADSGVYYVVTTATEAPRIVAGLTRAVAEAPSYLLIGANNVDGVIGGEAAGLALADGQLGLVLSQSDAGLGAAGYALYAAGAVNLQGFGGAVELSAEGSVSINTLGRAIDIDVPAGISGATTAVTFEDGSRLQEVVVETGRLAIDGLGTLEGGLVFRTVEHVVDGIETTDMRIGLSSVTGVVDAGGLSASLTNG